MLLLGMECLSGRSKKQTSYLPFVQNVGIEGVSELAETLQRHALPHLHTLDLGAFFRGEEGKGIHRAAQAQN